MNSIYTGTLRHRRYTPKNHSFQYPVFMHYFDIAHPEQVFRDIAFCSVETFNWLSYQRKHFMGQPELPLDEAVRLFIAEKTSKKVTGKIYLLTNLALFGYSFNPISIYVIYNLDNQIDMLVLEVTNTPWGETHCYLIDDLQKIGKHVYTHTFQKVLHVSPFMKMDYQYKLNLSIHDNQLSFHMENLKNNEKHFDATLSLTGEPLNSANMKKTIVKFPFMQFKVIFAIYWQALKLWLKGIKFISHPKKV